MEIVKKEYGALDKLFLKIVDAVLSNIKDGRLVINFEGVSYAYGRMTGVESVIEVHDISFFKKIVLSGEVGLGEAYMKGYWSSKDVLGFLSLLIKNQEYLGDSSAVSANAKKFGVNILGFLDNLLHKLKHNSKANSLKNISYHYDLSNEFYKLMLDETMTYSSALFRDDATSLSQAQIEKYSNLCKMLRLKNGQKILEIGSGWGGMARHLVEKHDVSVKTITISNQQFEYAKELFSKNKIENQIDLQFLDYRDLIKNEQKFDNIVSIEMIEAVGEKYLESYFEVVSKKLEKNGRFAMQAILMPSSRYEAYTKSSDWIEKYIFPGGHLPSVNRLVEVASKFGLELVEFEEFGLSYAKTLNIWRKNFEMNLAQVKKLGFDDEFIRMWEYYLIICESAFLERNIYLAQLCFTRPNN